MPACVLLVAPALLAGADRKISAPRFWNDKELSDWATLVAGLNVRPGHFSERDYYAAPAAEFLRTYPVYLPGREPKGYSAWLATRKPAPLLAPALAPLPIGSKPGRPCSASSTFRWFAATTPT